MDRLVTFTLGVMLFAIVYATQQPTVNGDHSAEFAAMAVSYQQAVLDPADMAPAEAAPAASCSQPAASESCSQPKYSASGGCSQPAASACSAPQVRRQARQQARQARRAVGCSSPAVEYEAVEQVCPICGEVHEPLADDGSGYEVYTVSSGRSHGGLSGPVRRLLGFERRANRRANRASGHSGHGMSLSGWSSGGIRGGLFGGSGCGPNGCP